MVILWEGGQVRGTAAGVMPMDLPVWLRGATQVILSAVSIAVYLVNKEMIVA